MLESVSPLLININLALMILVMLGLIGVAVLLIIILRNVNDTVKSAEASAASVKKAADKASGFLTAGGIYRAVQGARKKKKAKGEKSDE